MVGYEKFEILRIKKGVTVSEISKSTGIVQSTFSDWKKGKSKPKVEKLMKLADYFNVPVTYFLEEGEKKDE